MQAIQLCQRKSRTMTSIQRSRKGRANQMPERQSGSNTNNQNNQEIKTQQEAHPDIFASAMNMKVRTEMPSQKKRDCTDAKGVGHRRRLSRQNTVREIYPLRLITETQKWTTSFKIEWQTQRHSRGLVNLSSSKTKDLYWFNLYENREQKFN